MLDCIGDILIDNGIEKPVSKYDDSLIRDEKTVYEVLRVEEGIPLFIDDHLNRLENTLKICNIKTGLTGDNVRETIYRLIKINDCKSGPVKLLLSSSGFVAYLMKAYKPKPEDYKTGVKTILLHQERLNPNAKVWNQNFREMTISALEKNSVFEAVLVNHEGYITEGSRSNIFLVKNDTIYTSPSGMVLPGITRQKVLNICDSIGLEVKEEKVHYAELNKFNSLFLTGTSRKILPVKLVDNIKFSVENVLVEKISDEFEKLVVEYIRERKNV